MAVPDVPSYIQFAYGNPGESVPSPTSYHPGYGQLLRPLTFLGVTGTELHQAALIFNGLLAGVCVYLAAVFGSRLGLSPRLSMLCAGMAALYPGVSASSRIAWPETLLCVAVLASAIFAHDQTSRKNFFLGLLSGLLFCVHPRAIVVTVAVVVLSIATSSKRLRRSLLLGLLLGWSGSTILLFQTGTWQTARFNAAKEPKAILEILVSGVGQITAVGISSAGLAVIGVFLSFGAMSRVLRRKPYTGRDVATSVYLGIGFICIIALGGVTLAGSDRIDTAVYGRYVDPWVLPFAIVAVASLKTRVTKSQLWQLVWTLGAGVTIMGFAMSGLEDPARRIMTLSTGWLWEITNQATIFTLFMAAIALFIVTIVRSFPSASTLLLSGVFLLSSAGSTIANHMHLVEVGQIAEGQFSTAAFLPKNVSCLSHDVATTKSYAPSLYQLALPQVQHRRLDIAAAEVPCSAYLIAGLSLSDKCPNAELIATEKRGQWGLWHAPNRQCD